VSDEEWGNSGFGDGAASGILNVQQNGMRYFDLKVDQNKKTHAVAFLFIMPDITVFHR